MKINEKHICNLDRYVQQTAICALRERGLVVVEPLL